MVKKATKISGSDVERGAVPAVTQLRAGDSTPQSRGSNLTDPAAPATAARALIQGRSREFASIEEKLDALSTEWKEFDAGRSVTDFQHSAYLQIIGMGYSVVPLLLKRLAAGEGDWLIALKYITGEQITTPDMRGDFAAIRRAWLLWGASNGFGQGLQ